MRILSHGSSFRNRVMTSKVAPPQTSMDQNPVLFISGAMGSISAVRILVAKSDWCPSRRVRSVIFKGFLPLALIGLIVVSPLTKCLAPYAIDDAWVRASDFGL